MWKISTYQGEYTGTAEDVLLDSHEAKNIVVNTGRDNTIAQLLGFTWSASGTPVISMGVGASSDGTTDQTKTKLSYEYIGNASRQTLTNTDSETLLNLADRNDISLETLNVSGYDFYKKIIVQSVYGPSDGNNGQVFREYGLFTTLTKPSTPSATSGVMFNRFVDSDPITKSGSNSVVVQVTLRL